MDPVEELDPYPGEQEEQDPLADPLAGAGEEEDGGVSPPRGQEEDPLLGAIMLC